MRIVPIKDALQMAGEVVPCVRGRITDVDKQRSGGAGEDAWKFQKVTIADETGQIVVKIWGRDPIPTTARGQLLTLSCNDGPKGLTGLKGKLDEYKGKSSVMLNTSATCVVDIGDGTQAPQQAPAASQAATQPNTPPARQNAPQAQPASQPAAPNGNGNGHQNGSATAEAKQAKFHSCANDYFRVMNEVHGLRVKWNEKNKDHAMTPEHFQAAVATLYIRLKDLGAL